MRLRKKGDFEMIQLVIGAGLGLAGIGLRVAIKRRNAAERERYEREIAEYKESPTYKREPRKPEVLSVKTALIPMTIGAALIATTCFYSQDMGETVVLRNLGGSIAGHTETAGFHVKAPWQDVISYDVRNNLVNFYGDTEYSYDGGSAEGKKVTVNDKSGAKADIDIQVNYSLDPSTAEYLYSEYGDQTTFTKNYVSNDLRSIAREVAGQFDTITMLTDRSKFTRAVQDKLTEKWEKTGLTVEQVNVQDITYPKNITNSYAEAQAAEVAKQKAKNEQETAKVQAETEKIEAQGEKDANELLSQSLTPEVIQKQYIDALKSIGKDGNLVVVPEGSQPIVQTE